MTDLPAQSAYIEIERVGGKWADRARSYRAVVDGDVVGTIGNAATERFEVSPGAHVVNLKIDWCRSQKIAIEVAAGETARFRAEARNPWGAIYWITFGCRNYMKFERVDGAPPPPPSA